MNLMVSQPIIESIFFKNSPLHDGAIIISNNNIKSTRVVLPINNETKISSNYGLRHRAAVSITEKTDASRIVHSNISGSSVATIWDMGTINKKVSGSIIAITGIIQAHDCTSSGHVLPLIQVHNSDYRGGWSYDYHASGYSVTVPIAFSVTGETATGNIAIKIKYGAGGGGGTSIKLLDVSSIASVTVTIGDGGNGGTASTTGGAAQGTTGGTSSFGTYATATGGVGGWGGGYTGNAQSNQDILGYPGTGGTAADGDINLKGEDGLMSSFDDFNKWKPNTNYYTGARGGMAAGLSSGNSRNCLLYTSPSPRDV